MGELVDQFDNFEKKLKDGKDFRHRERKRKAEAFKAEATSTSITLGPPSQKYRDNWERIFGSKSRNEVPRKGATVAEEDGMEVHQDSTEESVRRP